MVIIGGIVIAFEIESAHDKTISGIKQTIKVNRKWHRLDFYYLAIVSLIIAYLYGGLSIASGLILINIAGLRASYFPIRFNARRGSAWDYLGSEGYDKIVKKLFFGKNKLYFASAGLLTLASILLSIYFKLFK